MKTTLLCVDIFGLICRVLKFPSAIRI